MRKIISLLLITTLTLHGCPSRVEPRPTPVPTDKEYCKTAEENLKVLECISKTEPFTKKGKSFTEFCEQTQDNGIFLNPRCLSKITSCDQMDYCTGTKE